MYDGVILSGSIDEYVDPIHGSTWYGNVRSEDSLSLAFERAAFAAVCFNEDPEIKGEDIARFVESAVAKLSPANAAGFTVAAQSHQIAAFDTAIRILKENQAFFDWVVDELNFEHHITREMIVKHLAHTKPSN
jgi:hypothetical protein